jgi:hypothetical protein
MSKVGKAKRIIARMPVPRAHTDARNPDMAFPLSALT